MKIEEVCGCGASLAFEVGGGDLLIFMRHIRRFRREHNHVDPPPKRLASARALGYAAYREEDRADDDGDDEDRVRYGV